MALNNKNKLQALAVVLAATSLATCVTAEMYSCKVKASPKGAAVPENVVFEINRKKGQIIVLDDFSYSALGRATKARVTRLDDKRIEFVWDSGTLTDRKNQDLEVRMIGRYFPKKKKFTMRSDIMGYDNPPYIGRGECSLVGGTIKDVIRAIKKS